MPGESQRPKTKAEPDVEVWGYGVDDRMPDLAPIFHAHKLTGRALEFVAHFKHPIADVRGWHQIDRTHWAPSKEARHLARAIQQASGMLETLRTIPARSRAFMVGRAARDGFNFAAALAEIERQTAMVLGVIATTHAELALDARRGRPLEAPYRDAVAASMADWLSEHNDLSAYAVAHAVADILDACGLAIGENPERVITRGRALLNPGRGKK